MLSGEGMQRQKTMKSNNRSNQQKQLCTRSTLFSFTFFFAVVLRLLERETFRNFLVRVPVHFFSLPLIFTLHWWPLEFLILSPSLQNFHVVLQTKKSLLPFFISRSKSLSPFFALSFAGLPPTFSFSPSFSCSTFQICGRT